MPRGLAARRSPEAGEWALLYRGRDKRACVKASPLGIGLLAQVQIW